MLLLLNVVVVEFGVQVRDQFLLLGILHELLVVTSHLQISIPEFIRGHAANNHLFSL